MFHDLILNASLLVALTTLYNLLARVRKVGRLWTKILAGLLFGGVAIAGMAMPFHYAPGIIYDGRSIVMAMAGLFGGGTVAMVSILVAGAYQAYLGGNGVWAGVTTIMACALVGLGFRRLYHNRPDRLGIPALYALGISASFVMLACQLMLIPWPAGPGAISRVWLPVMLIFPAASVLMGVLLRGEDRRLEAEATLRASQRHYQTLSEISPVGIFYTDARGKTTYVNPRWCEISACPAEEALGYGWLGAVHPDDQKPLIAGWGDAVQEQRKSTSEFRLLRPDGTIRWVMGQATPETSLEGKIVGYVGTITDITERKRAEEALRASEAMLKRSQAITYIGSWELDIAANRLTWSDEVYRMFGVSPQEFGATNEAFLEFVHPDDRAAVEAVYSGSLRDGCVVYEIEHRIVRRDNGEVRVVHEKCEHIKDASGRIVFSVGMVQDITERKQAEEKLEQERILLRTLIDNLPDLIYVMDVQGRKILSNVADWQASGGNRMEDILGKTDLEIYPPELANDYWAHDKTVIESGISILNREEPGLDPQGNRVWRLTSKLPLRDGQGKVVGLVGVGRDITELKQAEEKLKEYSGHLEEMVQERTRELREAQEKLVRQEKLAILGQLAGSVSHELRNPLSVIGTSIYYLKLVQPEADAKIKEHHAMIEQEVHNADKIITDLLDFARVVSVEREAATVPGLVQRTLERFPAPAEVELRQDIPSDLPEIFVDRRQVEQVLGNLVVNACQAMPRGGQLSVTSDQWTVNGKEWVRIHVKDSGVGITPENMQKLFEPLFTTRAKGIGLGLAVSKKLVEANGGRLEVESQVGRGSTFTLYLPVSP